MTTEIAILFIFLAVGTAIFWVGFVRIILTEVIKGEKDEEVPTSSDTSPKPAGE